MESRYSRFGAAGILLCLTLASCTEPIQYPRRVGPQVRVPMSDPEAVGFLECRETEAEGFLVVHLSMPGIPFDREFVLPFRRVFLADLGGMYRSHVPSVIHGVISATGLSPDEPVTGHLIVEPAWKGDLHGGMGLEVQLEWRAKDGTYPLVHHMLRLDPRAEESWEVAPGVHLITKVIPKAPPAPSTRPG